MVGRIGFVDSYFCYFLLFYETLILLTFMCYFNQYICNIFDTVGGKVGGIFIYRGKHQIIMHMALPKKE